MEENAFAGLRRTMTDPRKLEVTLWGVRGSIPTPVAENLGYGGNTACVSLRLGDAPPVVIDGGSGLRAFGYLLNSMGLDTIEVDLLLTHFHWDHIQGIPFFVPLFRPNCQMTFHSVGPVAQLQQILGNQMRAPYFPVQMPAVRADCRYEEVDPGGIERNGLRIRPFRMTHPDGAHGYRIEAPGAVIVYASDHEHGDAPADARVREFATGADVLIYDAQYTPEEYESRRGWGHSTWLEATRVARDAGVKQLVLFHHDPLHNDAAMDCIVDAARQEFPSTMAAKERWTATF
jgi:phosphoribosyl 1,2-cyclic phosphodiesterase